MVDPNSGSEHEDGWNKGQSTQHFAVTCCASHYYFSMSIIIIQTIVLKLQKWEKCENDSCYFSSCHNYVFKIQVFMNWIIKSIELWCTASKNLIVFPGSYIHAWMCICWQLRINRVFFQVLNSSQMGTKCSPDPAYTPYYCRHLQLIDDL